MLPQVVKVIKSIEFPKAVLEEIKEALKGCINAQYQNHDEIIKGLQKEFNGIKMKISNWYMRCSEDMSITTEDSQNFLLPLRRRQSEIENELANISVADRRFEITLDVLLDLASRSYTLFESSHASQKRQILKILFANLKLDGEKLDVSLRKPFSEFVKLNHFRTWSG